MRIAWKHLWPWAVVLIGSAAAVAVPFLFYRIVLGSFLPDILAQIETDSIYYLTHIAEILRGHTLGNPYFFEHRDAPFAGLVLPVWIAAFPGFLGIGLHGIYLINALLYGMLTGLLFCALARRSQCNEVFSAAVAVLGVATLSNLLVRPVIMQTIYPALGLFALSLLLVIEKPHEARRYAFLGTLCVAAFYMYPYLWMTGFAAVGLFAFAVCARRDGATLIRLAMMGIAVGLACIPQILTIVTLFSDPIAAQMNARTELVATHAILPTTILNNKYAILVVFGLLAIRSRRRFVPAEAMLFFLSLGLLIGATSNVITGKEMDFDTHFWRLGLFLTVAAIPVWFATFRRANVAWERIVAGCVLAALILTTVNRTFIRGNPYWYLMNAAPVVEAHERERGYAAVFAYLQNNDIRDSVVLAHPQLGFFIPLYTENTVFYVGRAALHVVSDEELLERMLTFYVDDIDEEFLRNNVDAWKSGGPAHEAIYRNAYPQPGAANIARSFVAGLFGKNTEHDRVEPIDLIGGEAFLRDALDRHREIAAHYETYVQKYGVRFVVTDRESVWNPRVPRSAHAVFDNGRFVIYAVE